MKEHDDALSGGPSQGSKTPELNRRSFLAAPAAVAVASVALPALFGSDRLAAAADPLAFSSALAPRYYPLDPFTPELELRGKTAVITGASRGIGRATADALVALGVNVIGTSRNVARVPNPPRYPLLDLDISEPRSVRHFAEELSRKLRGKDVDILINNAGRFVLGSIVPPRSVSSQRQREQLQLGTDTLYHGHIQVTQELMPLMPAQGYARLLYTTSVVAYLVGGTDPLTHWVQGYTSPKKALLAYANGLRGALQQSGSNILVSTVNPYFVATTGAEHPNPIYTEPVRSNGFTDEPPSPTPFNQFLSFLRQRQAAGLPPSLVGKAYAQLLTTSAPPANVVVSSSVEPSATQAGTQFIESIVLAENTQSALPFLGV